MTWNPLTFNPARDTCPCCGWPLGNRSFAPPGGTAPCVADRYAIEDDACRIVPWDLGQLVGAR